MIRRRAQPGDVYAVPLEDGTFTACQVVRELPRRRLQVVEFDWIGSEPPDLRQLEAAAPLRLRAHNLGPVIFETTEALPPRRFVWLGSTRPLAAPATEPPSWLSDWERALGRSAGRLQRPADISFWEAIKRANDNQRARWEERVMIALDGEPQPVPLGCTELNVYEAGPKTAGAIDRPDPGVYLFVRRGAELQWSQLDQLEGLYTIRYRGRDRRFGDYLQHRWLLFEAAWLDHDVGHVSLGAARLRRFRVATPRRGLKLELPETIEELTVDVAGKAAELSTTHFLRGAGLRLTFRGAAPALISGLERLTRLHIQLDSTTLNLRDIPPLPELDELRAWGRGGSLVGLEALANFPRLRIIAFYEFFEFDAESFPPATTWPDLDTVEFHGLPVENARLLRRRLRDVYRLRISGTRPAEWIEATRGNPFHHWVDRDPAIAHRACAAYVAAARSIAKIGADAPSEDLETILKRFVAAFNRINRTGFVETVERDEIWAAFQQLAATAGLEPPEVQARFDQWREF
ncbi:MAG TPA: hypothetical protein VG144_11500 [Gaiellaceae bacterium]|nr:hypothetical protein [Gaiellaceae bacterium]